ncbi:LptA/OstA family protein [Spirochaeta isovalerica]|uniref:Lipopolysaccharide export system protein LptA n=1 Tax=Spirochaeta isovalerica TaxID=150 RepID=A0A841RH10_9SPIO|nr:hypothetical protein [Spirochaeta isovalerica]MBB6482300.1 lipopolysaccharide export system protein LptA [Spirochaeta isovalerica]
MNSTLRNKHFLIIILFTALSTIFGESIEFSADSMRYEAAEGKEFTLLSGSAFVRTGSKEIRADEIKLFGEDYNILLCEGNVSVLDSEEELQISSSYLYYDRERKITRINGRSEMQDFKNEMIIKSGFLEYRQEDDIVIMQIGVRILKEDLTCRCEFATYDKAADTLEMTGIPVVYKNEDVFRASQITVLLENDEIQMDGKVEGSLIIKDEESGSDPES